MGQLFNADDISILPGQEHNANLFCDKWEEGKATLQLLERFIKNPFAKLVLAGIIMLGDTLHSKFCS